ncbi:MAG: patatin-like phospholipase family protein [Pseudomonadota bacterium]
MTLSAPPPAPESAKKGNTKKIGLVLSSGAARGWAHIGVLRGLEELGVKPDVIVGCSVGALVGGAYLLNALDGFEAWARELKALSALNAFNFRVSRGGFFDASPAFDAFAEFDRPIEELPIRFGAVAADLSTGEEVWLTEGSTIDAARASSAIPVLFHARRIGSQWLVDGAVANPTPVSLARALGAETIIAVDLNAAPNLLDRFDSPPPGVPAIREINALDPTPGVAGAVGRLIDDTRRFFEEQLSLYQSRANAAPKLVETAFAAAEIFQMHLSRAKAQLDPPDILLEPDVRDALPTAFDRADEFIEEGRRCLLAEKAAIEALLARPSLAPPKDVAP